MLFIAGAFVGRILGAIAGALWMRSYFMELLDQYLPICDFSGDHNSGE